jgi:Exportin-5 family
MDPLQQGRQQQLQRHPHELILLKAIAIESLHLSEYTDTDRQEAYRIVQEFQRLTMTATVVNPTSPSPHTTADGSVPQKIALCIAWVQQVPPILYTSDNSSSNSSSIGSISAVVSIRQYNITTATKLLALEVLHQFIVQTNTTGTGTTGTVNATPVVRYSQLTVNERVAFRTALINAAHVIAQSEHHQYLPSNDQNTSNTFTTSTSPSYTNTKTEIRILARKVALVLKGLILCDFPQRWTTLGQDFFGPPNGTSNTNTMGSTGTTNVQQAGIWFDSPPYGTQICLECFKLVAEDCTDSDFNVKISTQRRNDVLQGLNEIAHTSFLPLFYNALQYNYPLLQQYKNEIHKMHLFLLSERRTVQSMTSSESHTYTTTQQSMNDIGQSISDTLITLEKFCTTLPVSWMLSGDVTTDPQQQQYQTTNGNNNPNNSCDFVRAYLHLLRESDYQIQVRSIECLEQLTIRGKLDIHQWMRLIQEIPIAFNEGNQMYNSTTLEFRVVQARVQQGENTVGNDISPLAEDALALQVDYHRALSRLLSYVLSSHVAHISSNKHILTGKGDMYEHVYKYLQLLVSMLQHPSGRIATEQINVWSSLFRDPQISKSILLRPFCGDILTSYMDHMVKIRWDDIENEVHPHIKVIEASFDDEDDYDAWMGDLRSRASLLFRFMGHTEPQIISDVLNRRVRSLLTQYGSGSPVNFVDGTNNQLTMKSESVIQFEALFQPLDSTLSGIPGWAMIDEPPPIHQKQDFNDRKRAEIRLAVQSNLAEICASLATWRPSYLWLKFRHASLLEALKHYWQHDPASLLQGVDTLIRYLGLPEEWNPDGSISATMSGEMVGLKKRSGVALVSIAKKAPKHLVPWLAQLSEATRSLLASEGLIPMNQMHLYEFLSCVATAVENPRDRSQFIADVLSEAVAVLESQEIQQSIHSSIAFLNAMGVIQTADQPDSATDRINVANVNNFYQKLFTPLNRLLSVGRRCNEAGRQRSVVNGVASATLPLDAGFGEPGQPSFPPDEGPLSLDDLSVTDPFVLIWPRILPTVLQVYEITLSVWRPENQAAFLPNRFQRYLYAISDDEAYLARTTNAKSGGVFGEGGAAGSVCAGTDRREINLVPKWSGWMNELRNTCFQLIGLLAAQRVLYSPDIAPMYPRIVSVLIDPLNLKSMEHRHFTQFLKHVVEFVLITCPCTLYATHLAPIIGPIFDHIRYRLEKSWLPVLSTAFPHSEDVKALNSVDCHKVAQVLTRGEDAWFTWYYAHAGLFVGDLDTVTSEAAVEKYRVDISRTFSDMLQTVLALKGDWALVLATQAKEEQATKKNDTSILSNGPPNRLNEEGVTLNADGTPRVAHQVYIDSRKMLRINGLCHFMLLENEGIAGNMTLTLIQFLGYPDAYTCRRTVKICHRILETVASSTQYSNLLGQQMFTQVVKNVVTEPKWMVGVEWDMINVARDIYCRLVLGQILQPGGQGPGQQQVNAQNTNTCHYEQAKTVDRPLQGGGILVVPSNVPRVILASLPGIGEEGVTQFEYAMKQKRSAKDQKDCIRDLLRIAADALATQTIGDASSPSSSTTAAAGSIFDRAIAEESLLHANTNAKGKFDNGIPDLPERLITQSQVNKSIQRQNQEQPEGLVAFQL